MPVEIDSVSSSVHVSAGAGDEVVLTPELIKLVTERVYALLVRDLQIDQERLRINKNPFGYKGYRR